MLDRKKVLLAISGSIAAYKIAFFVRLLIKAGAEVKVIMTENAMKFISPPTLATLSKNPVLSSFFSKEHGEWNSHVELALWADIMVIAPLTANTLSKMANGACDNLLMATYLSAKCPVMACPAMDLDMYRHPSTIGNLEIIRSYGNIIVEAEHGELASGLVGEGRMAEPENILAAMEKLYRPGALSGKKVMMTSGPTFEAIDSVRFIGNHSSGKMGKWIALELANRGASVQFISGPSHNLPDHSKINIINVTSADEMLSASWQHFGEADIVIFAAAVADYKPKRAANSKIKKKNQGMDISLVLTPDIAGELGKTKTRQITVGFALETDEGEENAKKKLNNKNLDIIVLNSLKNDGAGFAHDTNKVSVFDNHGNRYDYGLKPKSEVAKDLINLMEKKLNG